MDFRVILALCIVTAALSTAAGSAAAQSLGELAKKEAERRGTTPPATKTYTNDNLTPDFTKTEAPPAADAKPAEAAAGESKDASENAAATPEGATEPGTPAPDPLGLAPKDELDEQFWRTRAELIRARMASQNAQVEQLRAQMAAVPRDAPGSEREVVERTLRRAETNLKHINEEWLRFERQARERKVPDHWIR